MSVRISLQIPCIQLFWIYIQKWIILQFNFLSNHHTAFPPTGHKFSNFSISSPTLDFLPLSFSLKVAIQWMWESSEDSIFIYKDTHVAWLPRWLSWWRIRLPVQESYAGPALGWGRPPGGGNGNPLQYSCLGNPTDRGAWQLQSTRLQRVGHDLATEQVLGF